MPQIQKGTTYSAINNSVNFTNLNNLVDASTLLVGAISEQAVLTPNTVASTDEFIINDSGLLKKATASDILNSSLDATLVNATATTVITSAITPATGNNLNLNPSDAVIVTGKSFNCINGFDVVVFSTAHGLAINSIILVSASIAEYSGTFRVISASVDSFQYVLNTTAVPTGGTCSYTKKASVSVNGGLVSNSLSVSKADHRVDGVLYAKGAIQADGAFTSNGVANFTGTLQVNGVVGYVLTGISEQTIPEWNATVSGNYTGVFTSTAFTKPSDEIWVFELSYNMYGNTGFGMGVGARYGTTTVYTGTYKFAEFSSIANTSYSFYNRTATWVEGVGVVLTSETVVIDTCAGSGSAMAMFKTSSAGTVFGIFAGFTTLIAPSKFRIYKYRTA